MGRPSPAPLPRNPPPFNELRYSTFGGGAIYKPPSGYTETAFHPGFHPEAQRERISGLFANAMAQAKAMVHAPNSVAGEWIRRYGPGACCGIRDEICLRWPEALALGPGAGTIFVTVGYCPAGDHRPVWLSGMKTLVGWDFLHREDNGRLRFRVFRTRRAAEDALDALLPLRRPVRRQVAKLEWGHALDPRYQAACVDWGRTVP